MVSIVISIMVVSRNNEICNKCLPAKIRVENSIKIVSDLSSHLGCMPNRLKLLIALIPKLLLERTMK